MVAHRCFVCDKDNPERIVSYTNGDSIFQFDDRFEGPKGRAHGQNVLEKPTKLI